MQENIQVLASLWKLSFEQPDATKPQGLTSSEGHYGPSQSKFQRTVSYPVIQQDVNRLRDSFVWKLKEELFSSWIPDQEIKKSALKERRRSLIKMGSPLPAIGRSMTGGGEGPSAVEVATSFPARLLGAIEKLRKLSNSLKSVSYTHLTLPTIYSV